MNHLESIISSEMDVIIQMKEETGVISNAFALQIYAELMIIYRNRPREKYKEKKQKYKKFMVENYFKKYTSEIK